MNFFDEDYRGGKRRLVLQGVQYDIVAQHGASIVAKMVGGNELFWMIEDDIP